MSTVMRTGVEEPDGPPPALRDFSDDWAGDQETFRHVHWGKAMMWIFLLSDTFIFSSFLVSYMTMRTSVTAAWPNASEVFALTIGGQSIPLILIAIMTFVAYYISWSKRQDKPLKPPAPKPTPAAPA